MIGRIAVITFALLLCAAGCQDVSSWPDASVAQTPGNSVQTDAAVPDGGSGPSQPGPQTDSGAQVMSVSDAGARDAASTVDAAPNSDAMVSTSDAAETSASDAGAQPDGAVVDPVATCLPTANLAPGESHRTLQVGDVSRKYLLHVPPGYNGKTPVPLVIDWHGLLLDGPTQRDLSGYAELADKEGFIVAFPTGLDQAWNVGPCCTTSRTVDDVAFARALVAEIEKLSCIDPKRVYSAGFSMGGGMTMNLACRAADLFAAFAPAAFDLLIESEQACQPSRPVSIITFRGRNDFIVPYAGGESMPPNGLDVTIHFRGAEATFDFWKKANGCTGAPTMNSGCETYTTCAAGTETTLCRGDDLIGHIPGDAATGWATLKRFVLP